MNRKLRAYQISCYLNIGCVLAVVGVFIYQTSSSAYSSQDIFDFTWLFLIVFVYAVNFNFGIKLISFLQKESVSVEHRPKARKIFFALEIIVTLFYSFLVYYSIIRIRIDRFWPVNLENFTDLIVLLCLYAGYVASLVRIFLTSYVAKRVAEKNLEMLEQLGNEQH